MLALNIKRPLYGYVGAFLMKPTIARLLCELVIILTVNLSYTKRELRFMATTFLSEGRKCEF